MFRSVCSLCVLFHPLPTRRKTMMMKQSKSNNEKKKKKSKKKNKKKKKNNNNNNSSNRPLLTFKRCLLSHETLCLAGKMRSQASC